jgi:hypothetical protein
MNRSQSTQQQPKMTAQGATTRTEGDRPLAYRLALIRGKLTLQAAFEYQESSPVGSHTKGETWRSLPTVEIPDEEVEAAKYEGTNAEGMAH